MTRPYPILTLVLSFLLLMIPTTARALGPGGDVYLGYSRLGSNTFNPNTGGLNGWEAAGQIRFIPLIGLEADVSHYGLGAPSTVSHPTAYLFGPRITVGAAGVHFFVHGLIGGEHSSNAGNVLSSNAFAVAAGGGIDFKILPLFAWRINADYIDAPSRSTSGSHDRFGTGLVFRF